MKITILKTLLLFSTILINFVAPYACFCDETNETDLEFIDGGVTVIIHPENQDPRSEEE